MLDQTIKISCISKQKQSVILEFLHLKVRTKSVIGLWESNNKHCVAYHSRMPGWKLAQEGMVIIWSRIYGCWELTCTLQLICLVSCSWSSSSVLDCYHSTWEQLSAFAIEPDLPTEQASTQSLREDRMRTSSIKQRRIFTDRITLLLFSYAMATHSNSELVPPHAIWWIGSTFLLLPMLLLHRSVLLLVASIN